MTSFLVMILSVYKVHRYYIVVLFRAFFTAVLLIRLQYEIDLNIVKKPI